MRYMCDATEKEQKLIIDYGVEKSQSSATRVDYLH